MTRIRVRVNGEERSMDDVTHVAALVQQLGAGAVEGVAVAVNGEVVPRETWPEREVRDGDDIEIVRAVQGG